MKPAETCNDEHRRLDVRSQGLNGIDYIEVGDAPSSPALIVYFFGNAPDELTADHITIEGGVRITGLKVTGVHLCKVADPDQEDRARVTVDKEGDLSTYTLRVAGLPGFDPVYSSFDFNFKPGCPADLDCQDQTVCVTERRDEPEIDYLAKDYQGFRQLILDRWALLMPEWKESRVPDLGVALAEILAYTGDYLSYYQDAVATEAYIGTARQRVSLRRHARLVDYYIHEGCNARALVCLETDKDTPALEPSDLYFITNSPAINSESYVVQQDTLASVLDSSYEVFEPVTTEPIRLYQFQSRISFYTWGDYQCCLPKGATSATLKDDWDSTRPPAPAQPVSEQWVPGEQPSQLLAQHGHVGKPSTGYPAKRSPPSAPKGREPGWGPKPPAPDQNTSYDPVRPRKLDSLKSDDILIFMENRGPNTGVEADADPMHRQAVRITRIERAMDNLYEQPVVNIWWSLDDALAFNLCISSLGRAPDCECFEDVSIARGNVVLVDYGRQNNDEPLDGCVPLEESVERCLAVGLPTQRVQVPGVFRPVLKRGPLTFTQPLIPKTSASKLVRQDAVQAIPFITLNMVTLTGIWDASTRTGSGDDQAIFIFQQLCDQINGSYSGKLGSFNVCGTVQGSHVAWKLLDPPNLDPIATFSATLHAGVLEGTFTAEAGGTFRAIKRSKDKPWKAQRDLLASGPRDNHFVVEMDNDGFAHLRFGDGQLGRAPEAGATFLASYRTGNGTSANLGADTIAHMVLRKPIDGLGISKLTNPLPSIGGTPPEAFDDVKLVAPSAFRSRLERAITADDYASLAEQNPKVQRAAGSLHFTGSRYAVRVAIDPFGSEKPTPSLLDEIKRYLYRFRRIDHDLEVVPARYVPLDIRMTICVRAAYLRAHVQAAVLDALGTGVLADGRLGFFHPDNLSFGESIYLSRLIATAQAVTGVEEVRVAKLERLYLGANQELLKAVLPIGPFEIAQLDRDPNFPENGVLKLDMRGGR